MVNGKKQHASSAKRSSHIDTETEQPSANEDQPSKRSRVSRACDQCRASRERCDGAQPKCRTCSSQNRICSYNEQPKKRGIQPNYIRTLELTLAWIFRTYPEVEVKLTSSLPVSNDSARQLIGGQDAGSTETLHTAWRDSLINKQIEQMLSGSAIDLTGLTIGGNAVNISSTAVPYDSPPLSAPSDSSVRRPVQTLGLEDIPQVLHTANREALYQLPDNAWSLLEYYFAFTHSWLPMADKSGILKTMYCYPEEGLPRKEIKAAEHAEVWAIMALVSAQQQHGTSRASTEWFREFAESLLPTGNTSFELPHIRASIVISMIDMLNDHMLSAWLRIGSVVRLLYLFPLLKTLGQFTPWCRHMHLAAYVLESALASHMGSPAHLNSAYVTSIGFVDEDGMEEWAPWQDPLDASHQAKAPTRSFSTLNHLVRIYMRLEQDGIGSGSAAPMKSIALDLIKNAASPFSRIQPAAILTSRSDSAQHWSSDRQPVTGPLAMEPKAPDLPPAQLQVPEVHNQVHDHAFMSIPTEGATYNLDRSPVVQRTPIGWHLGSSLDSAVPPISPEARMDGTAGDIFEELASLERQDSIQQPQFLRNLGFSADLDLAEFFGEDYQPSDPLLAYLQPSGHTLT